MEWRSKTDQRHAYGFSYDANNRLLKANYGEITSSEECKLKQENKYSVPYIKYDELGNITMLSRNGLTDFDNVNLVPSYGPIDQLTYNYISGTSLLDNVSDGSSDTKGFKGASSTYTYDFGNLISDTQKGIDKINYTYNDLPLSISTTKGEIKNWYTADGLKVKSELASSVSGPSEIIPYTRNYIGGAEYVDNKLESVYVEEGRVAFEEDGKSYPEYFLKDHLGNVRARIADENMDNLVYIDPNNPEDDELMNIRHYYPFGMEWDTPGLDFSGNSLEEGGVKNKYTYNGKEFLDDLDINWHYYGFRVYDPAIARFTSVDPIAEQYAFVSGFNYAENKPINSIDLHGLQSFQSINASFHSGQGAKFAKENPKTAAAIAAVPIAIAAAPLLIAAAPAVIAAAPVALETTTAALSLEASTTTMVVNFTGDAVIQSVSNLASGKDVIENYDVVGGLTSLLKNPIIGSAIDGALDISGEGVSINSAESAVVNGVVGGGLGKTFGGIISDNKKAQQIC
jgi:RHS repeat-associated protein